MYLEFSYFNGIDFTKVLTKSTLSGVNLDKSIPEFVNILSEDDTDVLITNTLVDKNCLYDYEHLNNLAYILTPNGWELLITEGMELRPKGLITKDFVNIIVKPVIKFMIDDRYDLLEKERTELLTNTDVNIIVSVPDTYAIVEHYAMIEKEAIKLKVLSDVIIELN